MESFCCHDGRLVRCTSSWVPLMEIIFLFVRMLDAMTRATKHLDPSCRCLLPKLVL